MKLLQSGFYLHANGTFWRLVPADPTPAMLHDLNAIAQCEGDILRGYDAMLKAAPISPVEDELVEVSIPPTISATRGRAP
jgi:hypothetical protein